MKHKTKTQLKKELKEINKQIKNITKVLNVNKYRRY